MRARLPLLLAVVAVGGLATACDAGDSPDTGAPTASAPGNAGHDDASPVAEDAGHVPVTARSMEFDPAQLTVEVDEAIAIVLTSDDSVHDLTVDELDLHVSAEAGETAVGGFRAVEPGRYMFYCSVEGHRDAGVEGVVVVEA